MRAEIDQRRVLLRAVADNVESVDASKIDGEPEAVLDVRFAAGFVRKIDQAFGASSCAQQESEGR